MSFEARSRRDLSGPPPDAAYGWVLAGAPAGHIAPAACKGSRAEVCAGLIDDRFRRSVVRAGTGHGKTTLAIEAGRRAWTEGRFARVVYLPIVRHADARWATVELGALMMGESFRAERPMAQPLRLFKETPRTPTLLIWDHCENLVPGWSLEASNDAVNALLQLGVELTQTGCTRLIVTTPDLDLGYKPYRPSRRVEVVRLEGLAPPERVDAARALAAETGVDPPDAPALEQLAGRLDGSPLALRIAVALLAERGGDAADLAAELTRRDPGDAGRPGERPLGMALAVALESFDAQTRDALALLGWCHGGGPPQMLARACGLATTAWSAVEERLSRLGLARRTAAEDRSTGYLEIHPALERHLEATVWIAPEDPRADSFLQLQLERAEAAAGQASDGGIDRTGGPAAQHLLATIHSALVRALAAGSPRADALADAVVAMRRALGCPVAADTLLRGAREMAENPKHPRST